MLQAPTPKSKKRSYSEISVSSEIPSVTDPKNKAGEQNKRRRHSFFNWLAQQTQNAFWNPLATFFPRPTLPLLEQPIAIINPNHLLLRKVAWAHGSGIATLIGAHFTDNKLFPFGRLQALTVEKGIVPFSGTFDGGSLLCGVNQRGISGVTANTGYRFSDAWRYAHSAGTHISNETLEQRYLTCLQSTYAACSSNTLTEEKINQFSLTFAQLKSWTPEFINKLASLRRDNTSDKKHYHEFKTVLKHIFSQLTVYKHRIDRLRTLLGDNRRLSTFMEKVIARFFAMTQKAHDRLVGANRYGLKVHAKELLLDAIYLEMRYLKLIFTRKHQPIVAKITYNANSLDSFGGWPVSALASGVTALDDIAFETQFLAFLTGFVIRNAKDKLGKALGIPTDFVFSNDLYNVSNIASELAKLEAKVNKHHQYISTCLRLERNTCEYSEAEKLLLSKSIPILYCASHIHRAMQPAKYECLWEAPDGVPLGEEHGINILLTDTQENQAHIQQYLKSNNIANVSVGLYDKELIGKTNTLTIK